MKKVIQLIVFAALVSTLALSALAQTTPATNTSTAASGQDDTEAKAALYKKFTDNIKTNPEVAYEAGKEYLTKYEAGAAADDPYVKYIKKWVASYEKVARRTQLIKYLEAKDYNNAFASAKPVLGDYPDDLGLLYDLSRAGFTAASSGNKANNADALNYARRTIQLIQSGKSFDPNKPLTDKEKNETLGLLNYGLGVLVQDTTPTDAVNYFIAAAQTDSEWKKNPSIYALLYSLYAKNDYIKLKGEFEANCKTEEQANSQACKDLTTKVNQVVDHMIDALARAVAYADASPKAADFAKYRSEWMNDLTGFYKYRSGGTDNGLKELLASITSRPIPKPGEAVMPPLTPQSTPSTSSTSTQPSSTAITTTTGTTAPKTTTPATTQPSGKATTTQPASKTTTSGKTTPKRAH